ncbi:hypothetical protein K2X33_15930 [bacterium]|nr:hypothetical protein [bacterium]
MRRLLFCLLVSIPASANHFFQDPETAPAAAKAQDRAAAVSIADFRKDLVAKDGKAIVLNKDIPQSVTEANSVIESFITKKGKDVKKLTPSEKYDFVMQCLREEKPSKEALRGLLVGAFIVRSLVTQWKDIHLEGVPREKEKALADQSKGLMREISIQLNLPDSYWNYDETSEADKKAIIEQSRDIFMSIQGW